MIEPIWEKQPGESSEAFRAFAIYRDLDITERSYDKAWAIGRASKSKAKTRQRAPGQWRLWIHEHRWKERAEAYDAHRDRVARSIREAAHRKNLETYYEEKREASAAISKAALEMLKKAQSRLKQVKVEEIPVERLPAFLRAAAALYDAAGNAHAESLAVDQILGVINAPASEG